MIKTDITLKIKYNDEDLLDTVTASLPISRDELGEVRIVRRTLSLADTAHPHYRATVALSLDPEREAGLLKMRKKVFEYRDELFVPKKTDLGFSPIVVGSGPAGLFAALALAEAGASPIVLERGLPVDERRIRVDIFNSAGILDPECNIQFGEGGAGTFSDGKLKVGSMDKYKMRVLSELAAAGADPSILFASDAHVGTDKLAIAIKTVREKIISLGGRFIFSARFSDITFKDGRVSAVSYIKDGREETLDTRAVILAPGHSAHDTIRMLHTKGLKMTPKGFGVGVRIEHPREYINSIVYKEGNDEIDFSASYHLVTHLDNGRSVYSFCMCPGGTVVAAASEEGGIVTNGMSEEARMADNSNAALLVSVTPADFGSDDPLAGFDYQRRIEHGAYLIGGEYRAPAESLSSFLGLGVCDRTVTPSYPRGTVDAKIERALPGYITESLKAGIYDFDKWMAGYLLPGAMLTAPETRTTSPVRIERDDGGEAVGFMGVYPAGEGAGYAGGIVSSAVDGLRQAEKLLGRIWNT